MKSPLFLIPFAMLGLSACDMDLNAEDQRLTSDGEAITTAASTTGPFTKIEAVGPDNIVFVTGDTFSIKADGDADEIAKLRYAMDNGTIIIGREKGKWWGEDSENVTVTVTAPTLTAASLAGSGDFTADKMAGDEVELDIAGSGSMNVGSLTAKKLKSDIAGAGDMILAGKVDGADYSIAGSGKVDAAKLSATDADVSIAGSGDLKLNATGKVDVSIAGSGDVDVIGGAKCTTSKMGSGRVKCS
jgi:Putative auto-transporter adhesin, head GIN domain